MLYEPISRITIYFIFSTRKQGSVSLEPPTVLMVPNRYCHIFSISALTSTKVLVLVTSLKSERDVEKAVNVYMFGYSNELTTDMHTCYVPTCPEPDTCQQFLHSSYT